MLCTMPRGSRTSHVRTALPTVGLLLIALALPATAASAHRHGHRGADAAHHHGHVVKHGRATHRRARHPHERALGHRSARSATAPIRLFAPTSIWNQSLPADAAIDPASATLVSALTAEVAREQVALTGPWINTSNYSTPIYVVGPSQPPVRVTLDDPTAAWRLSLQAAFQTVPIPANAVPAVGTDAQMTIYQPATNRMWEFWRARKSADGWHAAWGGAIDHVSQSPGYYNAASWIGSATNWGASASSLPLVGGTMTIADLQSGSIDHALAMQVPFARAGAYALPAQRTDGLGADASNLPEGAHLRLDPNLDVRALHLPHMTEMMALAAQRYGIVVRDQSHHAIGFYGEDPTPTGSDPYRGAAGFYGNKWPADMLKRFPWGSLRVLKMDLQQVPAPPHA
jgi:hypothetical protein